MKVPLPLLALTTILVLSGCTTEAPETVEFGGSAEEMFAVNCSMCHGKTGGGVMGLAPDLRPNKQYWNPESLVEYLRDPKAYAKKDERLGARQMPAISNEITDEQVLELAGYVLGLMK